MDVQYYFQFVLALAFVLALFGSVILLARRFGLTPRMAPRQLGPKRLSLVEIMPLDSKRRLVLLRRDQVEHLIILGPESETVIETNITAPSASHFADMIKAEVTS